MKTSALLKLHQRQVDVLDMINTCSNRIHSKEVDLRFIQANTNQSDKWWYEFTNAEQNAKESIQRLNAIKQRLIRYYIDIQKRITAIQPTIEITTITEMDLLTEKG